MFGVYKFQLISPFYQINLLRHRLRRLLNKIRIKLWVYHNNCYLLWHHIQFLSFLCPLWCRLLWCHLFNICSELVWPCQTLCIDARCASHKAFCDNQRMMASSNQQFFSHRMCKPIVHSLQFHSNVHLQEIHNFWLVAY